MSMKNIGSFWRMNATFKDNMEIKQTEQTFVYMRRDTLGNYLTNLKFWINFFRCVVINEQIPAL